MSKSKKFYSYEQERKFVAFVDIIGFGPVSKGYTDEHSPAMTLFTFFENCVLPTREFMLEREPKFVRETIVDLKHLGHADGFWYNEVPLGAVNFVYLSDSLVLYSASLTHLVQVISDIYGRAIVWGVPLRAGISVGDIHHSEWIERPGTAICLYGGALTKAVEYECAVKGAGMRIWLEPEVEATALSIGALKDLVISATGSRPAELKWWRGALVEHKGKPESYWLDWHFNRWFNEKKVSDWFKGANLEDTKVAVAEGIKDLSNVGR